MAEAQRVKGLLGLPVQLGRRVPSDHRVQLERQAQQEPQERLMAGLLACAGWTAYFSSRLAGTAVNMHVRC